MFFNKGKYHILNVFVLKPKCLQLNEEKRIQTILQ